MEHEKLCLRTRITVVGADYDFLLRFEVAFPEHNYYSLRMNVSWLDQSSSYSEYYLKTSQSWFALWTREFAETNLPLGDQGSLQLYQHRIQMAIQAETLLDTVPAIQQAILAALRDGASFQTSHKEGGTKIFWNGNSWVRSDYGEHPEERRFKDESEFLHMLLRFFHMDVTQRSGPEQRSELDIWQLILRRLDPASIL
jgi:hypothetical protein